MTASITERAPAKVNLTLRIVGCRADGYHELESLVAFARLADTLTLAPDEHASLDVTGPFAAACGPPADNLVLKAHAALRQLVGRLKAGRFLLEKNLPVAAGIGGGSADAAAALRLLARLNGIAPDDPRVIEAARAVGADVPVCLDPRPRIMRGIGEILSEPLDLAPMPALLVNPRVPLATRAVFAKFAGMRGGGRPLGEVPAQREAMVAFLDRHGNDLTEAAIACAPVVGDVLATLNAVPGVKLARMSGSGPTCFALFAEPQAASAAAGLLAGVRNDWWVAETVLG